MYLIGVDCATEPKKTGIALAELGDEGMVRVCDVEVIRAVLRWVQGE